MFNRGEPVSHKKMNAHGLVIRTIEQGTIEHMQKMLHEDHDFVLVDVKRKHEEIFENREELWPVKFVEKSSSEKSENNETMEGEMSEEEKTNFETIAESVGKLVAVKNKAYGNSFADCSKFLKILYPNGIPAESYSDMLCVVRIFDKLKRIATDKDALGESPYRDIAGYAILGIDKDEQTKRKQ